MNVERLNMKGVRLELEVLTQRPVTSLVLVVILFYFSLWCVQISIEFAKGWGKVERTNQWRKLQTKISPRRVCKKAKRRLAEECHLESASCVWNCTGIRSLLLPCSLSGTSCCIGNLEVLAFSLQWAILPVGGRKALGT